MCNINITEEHISKEEYNAEPVVYCKHCLSLKVMILDDDVDYCDECGCTDTAITDIETWKQMYEEKYNKPFLIKKKKHGREESKSY